MNVMSLIEPIAVATIAGWLNTDHHGKYKIPRVPEQATAAFFLDKTIKRHLEPDTL